jgi:hypothetical protein
MRTNIAFHSVILVAYQSADTRTAVRIVVVANAKEHCT